jgi:chromosome condensin MukBEF MukE localization factor
MSVLIFAFVVGLSHGVLAQALKADQHAALMDVYNSIGLNWPWQCKNLLREPDFFFFFFFIAGCSSAVCPRFVPSSLRCVGARVACFGGDVKILCILISTWLGR